MERSRVSRRRLRAISPPVTSSSANAPLDLSRARDRATTRRGRGNARKGLDRRFARARGGSARSTRASRCDDGRHHQSSSSTGARRPAHVVDRRGCFDERARRWRRARRARRRSRRRRRWRDEACARRRARARAWDRRWNPWRRPRARCVARVDRAREGDGRWERDGGLFVRGRP